MKEEQIDHRGYVLSFIEGGQEYLLIFSHKGAHRGSHRHDKAQSTIILSGYVTVGIEGEADTVYFGDLDRVPHIVSIEPNKYHTFSFDSDSLIIERRY